MTDVATKTKRKKKKTRRSLDGAEAPKIKKNKKKKRLKGTETGEASSSDAKGVAASNAAKFLILSRQEEPLDGELRTVYVEMDHPDDFDSTAACKRWIRSNAANLQGMTLAIMHVKGKLSVQAQVTAILKMED